MLHMYDIPGEMPPCCVAVGRFDGVHRGHLALVRRMVEEARERDLSPVVVSLYDPDGSCLTTEREKALIFQECGVETMVSLEMNYVFQAMSPAAFTQLILKQRINARCAVAGADHANHYPGLETFSVPLLDRQGAPLSTGQLQAAFEATDLDRYTDLCGRPFLALGTIGHGRQLGRTVGMPTANLVLPRFKRRPAEGVYATISTIGEKVYMGVTNVGRRPTVDNSDAVTVETNLLDVNQDLYGETELLEFHLYIRPISKFDTLEQVKDQVDRDLARVKDHLSDIVARRQTVPVLAL